MSVDELEAAAKHLSERERFELGQRLLSESFKLSAEQEAEIMRRAKEIESGSVELIDGDVVDAEADSIMNEAG